MLAATELASDADTSLLLHFNGDANGVAGELPLFQTGIDFQAGLVDQAAHTGNPGRILYPTASNIQGSQGTVEFWIRPDWNGNTGATHAFFEVGDNFNNGMLLAIDGANNLRFIQWGDDPTTPAVEAYVERGIGASGAGWTAGNWYHVAATWDGVSHQLAYYVNGQLLQQASNGVQISTFSTTYLSIGSEVAAENPAQATFEEFRVSTRARSAAEILDDYNAGLGLIPIPQNQAAFALNHAVSVQWQPISSSGGQFDHYAIYRSQSPFTSVDSMTAVGQVADINTSTFLDTSALNGTSYYYAVTAVFSGGVQATGVTSVGPRTPRDELDLQVVSISRSPEFPRYSPEYANHEVTEPSGFGPYDFSSSSGLGGGQTFSDPRFPSVGQQVTYTATVRNRGTDTFQGSMPIIWRVDGNVVSTATPAVNLAPGETATFTYVTTWDDQSHSLVFSINVADARSANNTLASDPFAAPYLTYIDRTFVERFREEFTANPATQDDDIIDWLNEHMTRFNELFAASGSRQRVHYGVLQVVDDGQSLPSIDMSPYAIFPLRYSATDGNPRLSGYYHADEDIDYGLLHEMGHQLGLIDIYQFDVAPSGNLVNGQGYSGPDDLMRNVAPFLSPFSALATDHWAHDAHGYFGQFMYDLPQTIQLRILGFNGQPLPGATIQAFQLENRPGVGHVIANQVKFQGTTGPDGILALPNISVDPALVPTIATGDALHANPFGYVDVVGSNGLLLFKIEYNGFVDYAWLDISEPNVAYFQGHTVLATIDRQVALGGPIQIQPPSDLTELNATDWTAWAQGATAHVEDDTSRKLVGNGSVALVTDGGFDTYMRYPRTFSAQWDLSAMSWMSISFYAENSNIGFQTDSDPVIRLKDANGNAFQYEYYVNGNPYPLLNDARNTWRSYQIPLNASDTTTNGWRRTTLGTPDISRIQSMEIHADTWDYSFKLWVDGVGFGPASVASTKLFYKGSTGWDVSNNNLPGFSDDNAIAPDKSAYLPGSGAASFANISSYTRGINGLMVDLAGSHGNITANDFIFKVGNNNSPSLWATAAAPTLVTTRSGAGTGGSDRVELVWADNAIQKTWLEVVVKGNDALGGSNTNIGLASSYVFCFGNALADSGTGDSGAFVTNSIDEQSARNDPHSNANKASITNVNDFNRDRLVNTTDQQFTRLPNANSNATAPKFINIAAGGPFAPDSEGDTTVPLPMSSSIDGPNTVIDNTGSQGVAIALAIKGQGAMPTAAPAQASAISIPSTATSAAVSTAASDLAAHLAESLDHDDATPSVNIDAELLDLLVGLQA